MEGCGIGCWLWRRLKGRVLRWGFLLRLLLLLLLRPRRPRRVRLRVRLLGKRLRRLLRRVRLRFHSRLGIHWGIGDRFGGMLLGL